MTACSSTCCLELGASTCQGAQQQPAVAISLTLNLQTSCCSLVSSTTCSFKEAMSDAHRFSLRVSQVPSMPQ